MEKSIATAPIRVCIIEDQHETRNGIAFIISTYKGFTCTTYSSAEEALEALKHTRPQVVLMDIHLPGMDGIACTRYIKHHYPEVQIMMCTVFEDTEKIFNALEAGASGYILKRSAGEILVEAIQELVAGGSPMSCDIARKVVSSFHKQRQTPVETSLTARENEILDLLGKGYSNKEIAQRLHVSVHTIRTHVYNIYEKLHVHNKIEALNKTGRI